MSLRSLLGTLSLSATLLALFFFGCAKSDKPTQPPGGGNPDDTLGTPNELTFEQRDSAFAAVDSAYATMIGDPPDVVAAKLSAFLNTRPEFDSAGVIDEVSVWAWFTDDRIIIIPNNRVPTGSNQTAEEWPEMPIETEIPPGFVLPKRRFPDGDVPTESGPSLLGPAAADYELPHSIQARVISTLGTPCFTIGAPIVKKLLEDHGYVTVPSSGSVPALLSVSGDGLFFMDAHGGPGVDRANNRFLSLWTATPRSFAGDSVYASLLRKHELVYMYANDRNPSTGACGDHFRYAFTGKFVAQYMNFASNSLVMINACLSDSVPSLRQGFSAAGASVFAGWTRTVHDPAANRAADFLVDRLLGANASTLTPKESPPQRSFDVDRLWQDMKNRSLDTDPINQSKLRVHHLNGNFGTLASSIRYMFVLEHTDSLFITGIFGSDPGSKGRVIVGGTELPVLNWTPEMVTCFIPNTGAGSAGPVTVEVDGRVGPSYSVKRKSNVVNLTEWRGDFTYTMTDAGSLTGTIVLHTHLRHDIHPFRETPHANPTHYSIIAPAADDSYGTATATGSFSYTDASSDPPETYTWTWSGSDFVKRVWDGYPNIFLLMGQVIFPTHKLDMGFLAFARVGLVETYSTSSEGQQSADPLTLLTPQELYDGGSNILVDMSATWDIVAGQRIAFTCCSHDPDNAGVDDVTHTLSWPTIPAYFAPDTTAAQ